MLGFSWGFLPSYGFFTSLLIPSRILQPSASTSLYWVFATQLVLSLNLEFFSKIPGLVSVKYTLLCILLKKSLKFLNALFLFSNFYVGINFVPSNKTRMVDILGLKLFDRLCRPIGITWFSNRLRGAIDIS